MSFGEVQLATMPSVDSGDGYRYVRAAEDFMVRAGRVMDTSGTVLNRLWNGARDAIMGPPTPLMKHQRFCSYLEHSSKNFGSGIVCLERRASALETGYELQRGRHLALVKDLGDSRKKIVSLDEHIATCREGEKMYSKEVIGTIDFTTISLAKLEGTRDMSVEQSNFDLGAILETQDRTFLTVYSNEIAAARSMLGYARIARRRVDDLRTYAALIVPTYEAMKTLGNEFQKMEYILGEVKKSTGSLMLSAKESSGVQKLEDKKVPEWDQK